MSSETRSGGAGWIWAVVIIGGLIWFFNASNSDDPAPASTTSAADWCDSVLTQIMDGERRGITTDNDVIGDFSTRCPSDFSVLTDYVSARGMDEQGLGSTCDELDRHGLDHRAIEYLAADGYCSTGPNSVSVAGSDAGWVSWADAWGSVGTNTTVCGPVVNVMQAFDSTGKPTFLDIGAAYPDSSGVSVVIWSQDRGNFPAEPAEMYYATDVCVSGDLYTYEGLMQIEASSANQIAIQ